MNRTRACGWVALAGVFAGCGGGADAPRAGDAVTPSVETDEAWPAGGTAALTAGLVWERPGRSGKTFLAADRLPRGVELTAEVRFFTGDVPLGGPATFTMAPDC